MIELIIKPTNKCNFACSFCSSPDISDAKFNIQILKKYILQNDVSQIIVNGGDPLMMDPSFYIQLISFLDQNNLEDIYISITSNFWDFYIQPNKWIDVFKNKRIGLITSFQYGKGRYLANGQLFTQQLFLKVQDKYYNYFDRYLDFISVVTKQNQQFALDNVLLAKKLNVECKLNGAFQSGRQQEMYPLDKLHKMYLEILKQDLSKWQYNTKNLINFFHNKPTQCPLSNRKCIETIRCMQANMNISMCPSLDDDFIFDSTIFKYYQSKCHMCEYFMICNGCMKRIRDLQQTNFKCDELYKILTEFKSICLSK